MQCPTHLEQMVSISIQPMLNVKIPFNHNKKSCTFKVVTQLAHIWGHPLFWYCFDVHHLCIPFRAPGIPDQTRPDINLNIFIHPRSEIHIEFKIRAKSVDSTLVSSIFLSTILYPMDYSTILWTECSFFCNVIVLLAVMRAVIVSPLNELCHSDITSHPVLNTLSMLADKPSDTEMISRRSEFENLQAYQGLQGRFRPCVQDVET